MQEQKKTKKGTTLLEVIVVISIITIMTGVSLVYFGAQRQVKEVEAEAQKFAAVLREMQNNALTGKQVDDLKVPCAFGVRFDQNNNKVYIPYYTYHAPGVVVTDPATECAQEDIVSDVLESGVEFSSGAGANEYEFTLPHGRANVSGKTIITLRHPTGHTVDICMEVTGRVGVGSECE
ncbi:MAG: hypothetical protein KC736_02990 [Candidatus Moranbacteria bacterium]|nr:hypothetical protein [Candidatus Moranbacteria bacterium]